MKRLLAAIGALTVASLFVMGPVLGWLEELAWGLDKPGYWSLEQAFTIALVLLALLYVLFGLLVARWSDIQGLRVAASVALAIPFTLGFMWLFSSLLHGLVTSGVVDLSWAAHSPVWRAYVPQLAYAGFHLVCVVIISNLFRPAVPAHLARASS